MSPADKIAEEAAQTALAAIRAEAERRVPEWQPWMREWCLRTNWGEKRDPFSEGSQR